MLHSLETFSGILSFYWWVELLGFYYLRRSWRGDVSISIFISISAGWVSLSWSGFRRGRREYIMNGHCFSRFILSLEWIRNIKSEILLWIYLPWLRCWPIIIWPINDICKPHTFGRCWLCTTLSNTNHWSKCCKSSSRLLLLLTRSKTTSYFILGNTPPSSIIYIIVDIMKTTILAKDIMHLPTKSSHLFSLIIINEPNLFQENLG